MENYRFVCCNLFDEDFVYDKFVLFFFLLLLMEWGYKLENFDFKINIDIECFWEENKCK